MKINLEHDHGLIVWGKLTRKEKAWAAMIVSTKKLDLIFEEKTGYSWVWWFNHDTFSHLKNDLIFDFCDEFKQQTISATGQRKRGIEDALKILIIRFNLEVPTGLIEKSNKLLTWALDHFEDITKYKLGKFSRGEEYYIPRNVIDKIRCVNGKNIQLSIDQNVENNITLPRCYKKAKVEYRYCLSCRIATHDIIHFHPLFHGSLCDNCFDKVKRLLMPIAASDQSNPVCCVCVSVEHNELVLCDTCVRSYCTVCLNIYCGHSGFKEILRKNPWSCFSCNEHQETIISGLLRRSKSEQLQNVYNLYPIGLEKIELKIQEAHILALEDKCGVVAQVVETLKWQHKIYNTCDHFSPAILENEDSMLLDKQNEKPIVTTDMIKEWFPIGILIKYFPNCHDEDEITKFDENGILEEFFDFVRVKNIIENIQSKNSNTLLWAFETSASISYLEQNIISRFCDGRQPILLGMRVKNVRHRGRFIWTNIPLQNIEKFQRVDLFLRHLKVNKNVEDQDPSSLWCYNSVYSVLSSITQVIP